MLRHLGNIYTYRFTKKKEALVTKPNVTSELLLVCDTTQLRLAALLTQGVVFSIPGGRKLDRLEARDGKLYAAHSGACQVSGGTLLAPVTYVVEVSQARAMRRLKPKDGATLQVQLGDRRALVRLDFRVRTEDNRTSTHGTYRGVEVQL